MNSVGIRYARLCDVPLAFMSKEQRAKFDEFFDVFVDWPCRNGENIPFGIDVQRFRLMLTPRELEIVHWRFWRWTLQEISERLGIPLPEVLATMRMIRRKATVCGFEWRPRGEYKYRRVLPEGDVDAEALYRRVVAARRKALDSSPIDWESPQQGIRPEMDDLESFDIPSDPSSWYSGRTVVRKYVFDPASAPDLRGDPTVPPCAIRTAGRGKE